VRASCIQDQSYDKAEENIMHVTRRDFLRLMGGAGVAPALSGLIAAGVNLAPTIARAQTLRIRDAKVTPSICPYCSVGCATLIHTVEGRIANIEGDPRSPINEGTLCPKGAAIFQLHVNPNRPIQVMHRAAGAADWEVWDLDRAMTRVTELMRKTREETFVEKLPSNGKIVNMTPGIFVLGGATLEIEFNHVDQKLMRGLGIVGIENQARI
jgi:formate dehydrogenase major subunit